MNILFKRIFIQTILLSLFICSNINAMRTESDFWGLLPKTEAQRIQEAKEYNSNHQLINEDFLRIIFSYCEKKGKQEYISNRSAYDHAKTLASLHIASQFFNKLMPFNKIIEFCKTLDKESKNQLLCVSFFQIDQTSYDDLICSALVRAGADVTTSKGGVPLFFYAKSVKMAQGFIKRGCDICKDYGQFNIVSHVGNKRYPAELMEFYLNKGVVPQKRILHGLVHELKYHCDSQKFMDEFFKKAELLLINVSDAIKNDLNWEHQTPLNKLLSTDAVCPPEFKERLIYLFVGNGCQTTSALGNNCLRNASYFDVNNTLIDEYILDDVKVLAEERSRPIKVFDSKAAYSLVESVKKNNVNNVTPQQQSSIPSDLERSKVVKQSLLNKRDEFGNTLLIKATIEKNAPMVKQLLNEGADRELSNNAGKTAFEIAMDNGDNDIATLLTDESEINTGSAL